MPTPWQPLWVSSAGVQKFFRTLDDGSHEVVMKQDVGDILDRNKAMANENDGYSQSRELRRVGSIPMSLIVKWREEEGWDAFDPAHADRLASKLNDGDFALLRTAGGNLGMTQDGGFR